MCSIASHFWGGRRESIHDGLVCRGSVYMLGGCTVMNMAHTFHVLEN